MRRFILDATHMTGACPNRVFLRLTTTLALMALPVMGLTACGHAENGIDLGDNPGAAVSKTDPALTAPPSDLRRASAANIP